jgi:hypothetical protein
MRLKTYQAKQVVSFLKSRPSSVLGGSASAYPQVRRSLWYKYRKESPRDIDLFVKDPKGAKWYIDAKPHVVDIHSFEMGGKPGRYFRFGFETQRHRTLTVFDESKSFTVRPLTTTRFIPGKTIFGQTWIGSDVIELHPLFFRKGYVRHIPSGKILKTSTMGKVTLKHEMIHQKYPWFTESMVRLTTKKPFFQDIYQAAARYYRTGKAQLPVKVKGTKLGEQLFRKGVTSVIKEKQYRWFKDIPDFKMTAEELILSARESRSPISWLKASSAEKQLGFFVKPETYPRYGKPDSVFGRFVTRYIKPAPEPTPVISSAGYIEYIYPKTSYPLAGTSAVTTGIAVGRYYQPTVKTPTYPTTTYPIKPSIPPTVIPPIISREKPSYKPTITTTGVTVPPYKPEPIPPYIPLEKVPTPVPPYKPYEETPYEPTVYSPPPPTKKKYIYSDSEKVTKKKHFKLKDWSKAYRVRKWKVPNIEQFLKIK